MDISLWTEAGRAAWPRNPAGFTFLGAAVDEIGKSLFAHWDLKAFDAALLSIPPEPQRPTPFGGRSMGSGNGYGTSRPHVYQKQAYEEAFALWEAQRDAALAANAAIAEPLKQQLQVVGHIASEAEVGRLRTVYRDRDTGLMVSIEANYWNAEDLSQRLRTCKFDPHDPFSRKPRKNGRAEWVFVNTEDLHRLTIKLGTRAEKTAPEKGQDIVRTKDASEAWYRERVEKALSEGLRYSRDDDHTAASAIGIDRTRLRTLRKEIAPKEWQARGKPRKSKSGI